MPNYSKAVENAWQVLHSCTTPNGLLASPQAHDNYQRVWARDAMIAGLAGILGKDETVVNGFIQSIITLGNAQAPNGQIPSNVGLGTSSSVSYGSLAGRVDATTWWVIGACTVVLHSKNETFKHTWERGIYKALELLNSWEFNQRGLMYTPLGGNWADEYISEGYNLYDQCLRLWALRQAVKVYNNEDFKIQAENLTSLIQTNYYHKSTSLEPNYYHKIAFENAKPEPYFWFQFGPQGYDTRWDMAANALVLLLDLHPEPKQVHLFVKEMAIERNTWMMPVFYPVIQEGDYEWQLLIRNYSYSFKNKPHHFHNGGVWPVFLGLLGLGLAKHGFESSSMAMLEDLTKALENEPHPYSFHEYWSGDGLVPGGVHPLAYTASGTIFLSLSANDNSTMVLLNELCS